MTTATDNINWTTEVRGANRLGYYSPTHIGKCPNGGEITIYNPDCVWYAEYVSPGGQHVRVLNTEGLRTWNDAKMLAEEWYDETKPAIAPQCRCICECAEPSTKVTDVWGNTRYVGFCRRCAANKCDGVPRGAMPDYTPDRRFTREPISEWPPAEACAPTVDIAQIVWHSWKIHQQWLDSTLEWGDPCHAPHWEKCQQWKGATRVKRQH